MSTKSLQNPVVLSAINNLLESLNDKDESVKTNVESSLIRIAEKKPSDVLFGCCDHLTKSSDNGKTIPVVFRVIEFIAINHTDKLTDDGIETAISLSIKELKNVSDNQAAINHNSPLEILVSFGRVKCNQVMDNLWTNLIPGQVAHFMILQCIGTLATANVTGIISFIKPIFSIILPTLGMIKQDHVKQSYAFAIGRICEAITEHLTVETSTEENNPFENAVKDNFSTEIAIAYDVLLQQWLPNREPRVCSDILNALSLMFPLLPEDKIKEQSLKVVPVLLRLYGRSIDRVSITQFLAAVLKTCTELDQKSLDPMADILINNLFDLVCVTPDYDKPQTVKGHFEVLRCFDLLAEIYADKIFDMLLIQLRNNNERERIKCLLVITHLTNTCVGLISKRDKDLITILKSMIQTEKSLKLKMILLKTIVALAEKGFINDSEFIKFIIRHCCQFNKISVDFGTVEEHHDFVQACNNCMIILSSTVGTIDDLLKRELLQYYLIIDYTDACSTIVKCLANLFGKNSEIAIIEELSPDINSTTTIIPSANSVFVRSLALLGNFKEVTRITNILEFLTNYCTNLNKHLVPLWDERIIEITSNVSNKQEKSYYENLLNFLTSTIKDVDDPLFAHILANCMADQINLYTPQTALTEFKIPILNMERGMLLKLIGVSLCHVNDLVSVETKIDLILQTAKLEKLEKNIPSSGFQYRLSDAAKSLGVLSRNHAEVLLKKLEILVNVEGTKKIGGSFFSGLNFMKDAQKDIDIYKIKLLVVETYGHVIENAPKEFILNEIDEKMTNFLSKQLTETKDMTLRKVILETFLNISQEFLNNKNFKLKTSEEILKLILKITIDHENLQLFPTILKISRNLMKINEEEDIQEYSEHLNTVCSNFFLLAQHLKTKFDSIEDDEKNSFLANYLNQSLPELNSFVQVIIEKNPTPACLDDINCIMEIYVKDKNPEVRICAGHVMNNALEVYMKSMKFGCEASSKFNQTGNMLSKIIPRCIDSNATVRHISIDSLKKILEISCIYETTSIATDSEDWIKDLEKVKTDITTDDPKEIYKMAGELSRIIGLKISTFQYGSFCKSLLYCINDAEQSSAIGASVVLKFFIQNKGAEMFHTIPEFVKESLYAVKYCQIPRAKTGVLKSLVALTKHHPKLVCQEFLNQPLPLDENVIEFWKIISTDIDLLEIILENFLTTLSSSCLFEPQDGKDDRQKVATLQPFAIMCALCEILSSKELVPHLKIKFPEIFGMLLTTLATYTNLITPMSDKPSPTTNKGMVKSSSKFGFIPNKEMIKMNPCQKAIDTLIIFLDNLEMEQVSAVLTIFPQLANSTDLGSFIELLTPMAIGLVNHFSVNSSEMKQLVVALSKYISSPYDGQRIAAIGLYSQLVPLKPCGEISSVIILHLNSSLNDPNSLVRGLCIKGLGFICNLTEHDFVKYSESSLSALLKGVDDFNTNALINIPLESMRGLSRILKSIPGDGLEMFQVTLAIRIRPFFENNGIELREAAILLFGDICRVKTNTDEEELQISESLKEQIFTNFISILLHLSESEAIIVRACKLTLRHISTLMDAPKMNEMIQSHLLDHGQLNYEHFIIDFTTVLIKEIPDSAVDFIESCLPFLKSHWSETRGNSVILIGLICNQMNDERYQLDNLRDKISILLRDENITVRIKAATSLGYMFGDI